MTRKKIISKNANGNFPISGHSYIHL